MRLDGNVVVDDCPCLSSLYVVHCITWPFEEYEAWWKCCGWWLPISPQPLRGALYYLAIWRIWGLMGVLWWIIAHVSPTSTWSPTAFSRSNPTAWSGRILFKFFNLCFFLYKNMSCFYNWHFVTPEKNEIKEVWLSIFCFLLVNRPSYIYIQLVLLSFYLTKVTAIFQRIIQGRWGNP